MTHVKGMAILGTLRYVKDTVGKERIPELVQELPGAVRPIYEHPILAGDWYPYEAYTTLLAVVTERLGGGRADFPADLGRFGAQLDVGSIFRIVATFLSPQRALYAAGLMWSRYCDTGRFVMTRIEKESAEGHIDGFPGISLEHERLLTGWIEGIGFASGAKEAHVALVGSVHAGSPVSRYDMRWVNR